MARAIKQMILELEPDMYLTAASVYPGAALDILDCRQVRWPATESPAFRLSSLLKANT